MEINWQTVIETGLGSASGAGIVLLIDYLLSQRKRRKINFNEAISIQLDLHQMLGISLRLQEFNEMEKSKILQQLSEANPDEDEKELWDRDGYVMFPLYRGDIRTINSKWVLTQFLTYKRGEVRAIVKYLADAQISYQILKEKVVSRNQIKRDRTSHESGNRELQEVTRGYFNAVDDTISDCINAFRKLYDYIENKFCCVTPVKLGYQNDSTEFLKKKFSLRKCVASISSGLCKIVSPLFGLDVVHLVESK